MSKLTEIYNHHCAKCVLHKNAKTVCMMGRGDVSSRAMIVGEGPGKLEDESGQPFIGRSGEKLTAALEKALEGDLSSLPFITNSVKCRPEDNATPSFSEIDACFDYLEKEVALIDPVAIMTLGNPALYAITGLKGGVTRRAGLWFQVNRPSGDPLLVLPNYHPAYVLRNPDRQSFFEEVVDDFCSVWYYGRSHSKEDTFKYARP